jgi:flagellar assembly factor FliW
MPLTLNSSRFGTVEISADAVIEFPHGLIGVPGNRYVLLARGHAPSLTWLQSVDDPGFALPIADPHRFFDSYEIDLSEEESERIGVGSAEGSAVYVTVRHDGVRHEVTANLRAPLLVSDGRGYQVINQSPRAPLRAPLLAETPAVDRAA